jgi:Zn-dependent protease with chaperone function
MQNYRLNVSDYRFEKEKPVLIGTMAVSIVLILLMFLIALPLGIGFLISIGMLIFSLHSNQVRMLGACVKVSDTQFPKIYKMAKQSAERLDIKLPPVYIMQSPVINAFATGFFGHYYVVLHSAILEACTDEELMFIIGHEFSQA